MDFLFELEPVISSSVLTLSVFTKRVGLPASDNPLSVVDNSGSYPQRCPQVEVCRRRLFVSTNGLMGSASEAA